MAHAVQGGENERMVGIGTEAIRPAPLVWSLATWQRLDEQTREWAGRAPTDEEAWRYVAARARTVLKTYSTSFFIVTRFLPPAKRARVEAIYAAVRYPDEIVDSFPLPLEERARLLEEWADLPFVGMDCVEVSPPYDHAERTSQAAAIFVWTYLCGRIARGGAR